MKTSVKILTLVSLQIIIIITSFLTLVYFESQLTLTGNMVNVAGKNRLLASEVLNELHHTLFFNTEKYDSHLGTLVELERNIILLKNGGKSSTVEIPPLPSQFNEDWNICGKGYSEHKQYYPKPGWVEHDPIEIWNKTKESVSVALDQAGIKAKDLRAIGLDNQGETCMVWDKNTGKPIYNAIVWQDRRTAKLADELKDKYGDLITQKTGLTVDAYFSALKIKWILDNVKNAWNKVDKEELLIGTLDTWLLWKMTGGQIYITDSSTASRTMLFNLQTNQWDDEILNIIGIPRSVLPEIKDSAEIYGYTSTDFIEASQDGEFAARSEPFTSSGQPEVGFDSSGKDFGSIRKGFSSSIWGKIAKAKYYPRIAQKRGWEGKPVIWLMPSRSAAVLRAPPASASALVIAERSSSVAAFWR